jgi:hypothetical protein
MRTSLRNQDVRSFIDWLKTEKGLKVQRKYQPWFVAEVKINNVWEAIYYERADHMRNDPLTGRGLRPLVAEYYVDLRMKAMAEQPDDERMEEVMQRTGLHANVVRRMLKEEAA